MLTICCEFTRIAKVSLDKAEKDGIRRKRKVVPEELQSLQYGQRAMAQAQALAQNIARPITPPRTRVPTGGSPLVNNMLPNSTSSTMPISPGRTSISQPMMGNGAILQPFSNPEFNDIMPRAPSGVSPLFTNAQLASTPIMSPGTNGMSFQQPFVPQDLWQMPMTLEWDIWNDLNNQAFTPFDTNDGMMNNPDGMQQ